MSANTGNTTIRDVVMIVAMIAIFVTGYALIKEPQTIPVPPQSHAGHAGGMESVAMPQMPTDYDGLIVMGNRSMDEGNYSVAAECYRLALEIDGTSPDVRTDFGACLSFMGLPGRALDEFKIAMQDDPNHSMSRFNAGVVSSQLEAIDQAIAYFEEYLAMDPNGRAAETAKTLMSDLKQKKQ